MAARHGFAVRGARGPGFGSQRTEPLSREGRRGAALFPAVALEYPPKSASYLGKLVLPNTQSTPGTEAPFRCDNHRASWAPWR